MKNKVKIILAFVLGLLVAGTGVYAATTLASSSVAYDNSTSGGSSTNVQGALDELYEVAIQCPSDALCAKAKLGDYVKMTPIKSTYTIPTSLTGYTSNQTINPSELNLWRIIKINTDGTIEMVSEYVSSTLVYFSGLTGGNNYIQTLNIISSQYANNQYTLRMRNTGYNGQVETLTLNSSSASVTDACMINPDTSNGYVPKNGNYAVDTSLIKTVIGTTKAYAYGTTNYVSYYLAHRTCGYTNNNLTVGGMLAHNYYDTYYTTFYTYPSTSSTDGARIRPIATLRADVTTSSGSGTSSSPWVLG